MTITGVLWLGWVKIPGHVEILPILEIMPTDLSYSTAIGSGLLMSALVLALATTLRGIARSWHRSHEIQLQIATARQRLQELRDTWQDSTHEAAPFQAQLHRWNGLRRFRVIHKTTECDSCVSFYLAPHDGLPVCGFHPGQFLTFSLRIPGRQQPVVRCYSLSDSPREGLYRCTIKRQEPPQHARQVPPGLASAYLCDEVDVGDLLDVQAPRGTFYLDTNECRYAPLVLIGAGIGITPILSMVNALVEQGMPQRVMLLIGFRNSREHPFKKHLEELGIRFPQLRTIVFYSQPLPEDELGVDFHVAGRIIPAALGPFTNDERTHFYMCGPGGLIDDLVEQLHGAKVPPDRVHTEMFGPSAPKRKRSATQVAVSSSATGATVQFVRSEKSVPWDPDCESLLELADHHNIAIPSGCRTGNCGTCRINVKSGQVTYSTESAVSHEPGTCLPCVAVPKGSIELDA